MERVEKSKEQYKQLFGDFRGILSSFFFGEVYFPVDYKQREVMTFAVAAKLFIM
jgi:hypothetical protein